MALWYSKMQQGQIGVAEQQVKAAKNEAKDYKQISNKWKKEFVEKRR